MVEPNAFAFVRDARDECVLVLAHRGAPPRQVGIADGVEFEELFSAARCVVAGGVLA